MVLNQYVVGLLGYNDANYISLQTNDSGILGGSPTGVKRVHTAQSRKLKWPDVHTADENTW